MAGLLVPNSPPLGRRPGHLEHRRGVGDGPAALDYGTSQAQPLTRSRSGIGVSHEDLRAVQWLAFSSSTPRPEVLPLQDRSVRSPGHAPSTNVAGQYTWG